MLGTHNAPFSAVYLKADRAAYMVGVTHEHPPRYAEKRVRALLRLWGAAASGVVVRHIHPKVLTEIAVGIDNSKICVRLSNINLPDNDNPDRGMGRESSTGVHSFGLTCRVGGWPGYRVARYYFQAMHATLQLHEAMEQVWDREQGIKVMCPHYGVFSRQNMNYVGYCDDGAFEAAIALTLGAPEAKKIVADDAARAAKELETEMEWDAWPE